MEEITILLTPLCNRLYPYLRVYLNYVNDIIYPFSIPQLLIYLFFLGFTAIQIPFLFSFVLYLGVPAVIFSSAVVLWEEEVDEFE